MDVEESEDGSSEDSVNEEQNNENNIKLEDGNKDDEEAKID